MREYGPTVGHNTPFEMIFRHYLKKRRTKNQVWCHVSTIAYYLLITWKLPCDMKQILNPHNVAPNPMVAKGLLSTGCMNCC